MRTIKFVAGMGVALSAFGVGAAAGDVLVDSGDPGGYDPGGISKAVYYDPGAAQGQFIAQAFTLPGDALITGIDSYLFTNAGSVVDVQLVSEIGAGGTPADQLARFTIATPTAQEAQFFASPPLSVFAPAGTYYVVYGSPNGGAGVPGYAPNDIGMLTFANTSNGSLSFVTPEFPAASGFFTHHDEGDIGLRVHGVLPEPGAGATLLLAGAACVRRRRRFSV